MIPLNQVESKYHLRKLKFAVRPSEMGRACDKKTAQGAQEREIRRDARGQSREEEGRRNRTVEV